MLALVAAILLTESSPIPKPFLQTRPSPILPISNLVGCTPASVARGSFWRPGGYARLTYYYRFPVGEGPTLREIAGQGGFQSFHAAFGPNPGDRAVRDKDGVRQVIFAWDLEKGETWKWAQVAGPAKILVVTEMPMEEPMPKRWHHLPELANAPFPPGFPTQFRFLKPLPLYAVRSDPLVPRFPRLELNVWVILAAPRSLDAFEKSADAEMPKEDWKKFRRKKYLRYESKLHRYGLVGLETLNEQPDPKHLLVQLKYRFQDHENGPRLQ